MSYWAKVTEGGGDQPGERQREQVEGKNRESDYAQDTGSVKWDTHQVTICLPATVVGCTESSDNLSF